MQTRLQKRIQQEELANKERMAVEALIEISNTPPIENDSIEDNFNKEKMSNEPSIYDYSRKEIDNARNCIAQKHTKETIQKYDKPIPELVKYCKYNGSYDQQIRQSIKCRDMETYHALVDYRNNMMKYDEVYKYLRENFHNLKNNISDQEVLNYLSKNVDESLRSLRALKERKDLEDRKKEVEDLKQLKYLKDHINAKERIMNEMKENIYHLKLDYDEKMKSIKIKYNY